jgi:mRNA interferase MazF
MTSGKVVLVPFPFDDLSATKVRPAVCLTDPIGPHRHLVLAFISSQLPPQLYPTDLLLDPAHGDFAATGLRVASVLRLHRMMTVTTALIQRQLGELSLTFRAQVAERLVRLFQL